MGPPLDEQTSAKVLRQVEFYFSDSNLPQDKFLLKCLEESGDGLVSLSLICSFSRMRTHLRLKEAGSDKVPSETLQAVAELLRNSSKLRVSDDGEKVGRIDNLLKPEELLVAVDSRSISAGPLRWNVSMEDVEAFFSEHAKVNSVRLPRHFATKAFCGNAVIEFSSEADAKKILELKLNFDGAELELKPKKLFDEELEASKEQVDWSSTHFQHEKAKFNRQGNGRSAANQEDNTYPKGLIVAFTLQKVASTDHLGVEESEDSTTKAEKEVKEVDQENQVAREDIKEILKSYGKVMYVEYTRGETSGYVRFETLEGAQKARAAAVLAEEGGLVVKDHIATFEAVEGEAEKAYWAKLRGAQDKRRDMSGMGSRDKFQRGRGRGGRFAGRGKKEDPRPQGKHMRFDEDVESEVGPPSKTSKME